MKKKIVVISLALAMSLSMLAGCGGSNYKTSDTASYYEAEESAAYEDYYEVAETEAPNLGDDATTVDQNAAESKANTSRKLIRTVNLSVETENFTVLNSKIKNKTQELGGYVESSSLSGKEEYHSRNASYTLRIPAANADQFIADVEGQGNVTESSENVQDVTLTYVDINSRKESLQVEYDRLEQLLLDADSIEELIYIEERLAEVRYEIQSIESQLRTYDNKVDYTTIYLYLSEVQEYTEPEIVDPTYGERLAKSMSRALTSIWEGLQGFSIFILVSIPYLLVIGLPIALILFIINKCVKKSKAKSAAKKEEAAQKAEEARRAREEAKADATEQTATATSNKTETATDTTSDATPYSEKFNK